MKSDLKADAREIFLAGLTAAAPSNLVASALRLEGDRLTITSLNQPPLGFDLSRFSRLVLTGAGKASAAMARQAAMILGDRVTDSLIITKHHHTPPGLTLRVLEGGHPTPDPAGLAAARTLEELVSPLGSDALVLNLVSGGGSSLLTLPREPLTLEDLQVVTGLLLRSGADINMVNTVRKHLGRLVGGGLAAAAWPATVVSLIISDVIGDPLDVISSGPTCGDSTTFAQARKILEDLGILDLCPARVQDLLSRGAAGDEPETPKPGAGILEFATNLIIGNNRACLDRAAARARELGYEPCLGSSTVSGPVAQVAEDLLGQVQTLKNQSDQCLIQGGEPTIQVTGQGLGGRNQHLALMMAGLLEGREGVAFLSGGTDGTDGPTDAAGGVVDGRTWQDALHRNLDPAGHLARCDSYNLLGPLGALVVTGPTGTNVMDLHILLFSLLTGADDDNLPASDRNPAPTGA